MIKQISPDQNSACFYLVLCTSGDLAISRFTVFYRFKVQLEMKRNTPLPNSKTLTFKTRLSATPVLRNFPISTQERSQEGESVVYFAREQNICSQTAKHSWTTLRVNRPSFLGSHLQGTWCRSSRPMIRKKNLHQMIIKYASEPRKINEQMKEKPSPTSSCLVAPSASVNVIHLLLFIKRK